MPQTGSTTVMPCFVWHLYLKLTVENWTCPRRFNREGFIINHAVNLLCIIVGIYLSGMGFCAAHAQLDDSTLHTKVIAKNLENPWELVFAPDGRGFLTERTGNVDIIQNNTLRDRPLARIPVAQVGESGLLGMALDPNFEANRFVYLYYTYSDSSGLHIRVSRFVESENSLSGEKVLLDKIPANSYHDGGRIKFGPDGKLYITAGEAGKPSSAQDLKYLGGKILRINPDGTIPADNPFPGSPVFTYGNRNPQGLAWDPRNGNLVETEHGPSGEFGWHAHDEINLIEPGKNYGWPDVIGYANDSRFTDPLYQTGNVTWAPSGAVFYTSDKIPSLKGKLLVATLLGQHLEVLTLDKDEKVVSSQELFGGSFGRLRDVVQAPDGSIYLLTSNNVGHVADDKVIQVVPEFGPLAAIVFAVSASGIVAMSRFGKGVSGFAM